MYHRGPLASRRNGSLQTLSPPVLSGPREAREPLHVLVTRHVERLEVYACSPDHLGDSARERDRAEGRTEWSGARV